MARNKPTSKKETKVITAAVPNPGNSRQKATSRRTKAVTVTPKLLLEYVNQISCWLSSRGFSERVIELAINSVVDAALREFFDPECSTSKVVNPRAWLYCVAVRAAWRAIAILAKCHPLDTDLPCKEAAEGFKVSAYPDVDDALELLKEPERQAVVLRVMLEWSLSEAAAEMQVSRPCAMRRRDKGVEALRKLLADTPCARMVYERVNSAPTI